MRQVPLLSLALALLALPLLSSRLRAQEPAPAGKKTPVLDPAALAEKQKLVAARLKKIEDSMRRVAKYLEKDNPEQAARLRAAFQRSKDRGTLDIAKEIQDLLKEEYWPEAVEKQKKFGLELKLILDILLDRDAEREELKEKIKQLESMKDSVEKLIKQERDQHLKSEKFANPEKTLQRAKAAMAKLQNLINRQNKLNKRTKNPKANAAAGELLDRAKELLKEQREMRGQKDAGAQAGAAKKAEKLAQDIAKHAQGLPDAMKKQKTGRGSPADQAANASKSAAENMKNAAARMQGEKASPEQMQKDAESDLRETVEALKRLKERHKRHDEDKLAEDQERIRKDAERLKKDLEKLERAAPGNDSGSGNVGKASGEMEKAEGSLKKGRNQKAQPPQDEAKKELEEAYKKLQEFEKELKRLIKLPDYDKLAKEQEKVEEDTADLLKKMKKGDDGQKPNGDKGGEPTPGQQGVQGAKKAMQRAKQNLRSKSAKRANSDQQEAIERLEKAKEELEEALRQLREEEQLMLLEALERRLSRMLAKQTKIFKQTLSLHNRLKEVTGKTPRALQDKGRQLGDGEADLAAEAEKVLEIMREEGTTVVIPDVLDDMRQDLDGLAARLTKLKTGDYTRAVQRDIIETLKELIEVIKEELNQRQGGKPGDGDSQEGDQDQNLLPTSAELKMLRSLQLRVNRRTSTFDRFVSKEDTERGRIAGKQKSTAKLTRTMADRLNREEDG